MKRLAKLFILLLLTVIYGCGGEEKNEPEVILYELSASPTSLSFSSESSTQSISIISNDEWTVSANSTWVTVSSSSGSGSTTLSVNVEENTYSTARSANLTIVGKNSKSRSIIEVRQEAGASFNVSAKEISFTSPEAGTQTVTVSASSDFSVSCSQDWITFVKNGSSIEISVSQNNNAEPRTGTVTISLNNSTVKQEIKITQEGTGYNLALSENSFSFNSEAASTSFSIQSNDEWTVSTDNAWITISPKSGSGDKTVTVSVVGNDAEQSRTGNIYVDGAKTGRHTISVSQQGKSYNLQLNKSSISASSQGLTTSVSIVSNDTWTVQSPDSWITVSPATGSNDGVFDVKIAANTDAISREGSITVTGEHTGSQTVKVTQDGVGYNMSVSTNRISYSSDASSSSFTIQTNEDWTVSTDNAWITVSPNSGSGDKTITVSVTSNDSEQSRSGNIYVDGANTGRHTISVSQQGKEKVYDLQLNKSSISVAAGSASSSFTIQSNDDWTVSTDNAWITVSPKSGSGDKTITVSVTGNDSEQSRTGNIYVDGANTGRHTISVSQQGKEKVYELQLNKSSISVAAAASSSSFTIQTNDDWTVSTDNAWITVSPNSGSGDKTITVSVTGNDSEQSRSGNIYVDGANTGRHTISVSQQGKEKVYELQLNKSSISVTAGSASSSFTIQTNDDWSVSTDNAWITVSPNSGSGDRTITVSVTGNDSEQSRTGNIYVDGANTGRHTISVSQQGKEKVYELQLNKSSISVAAKGSTESISITSNDNWTVQTSFYWINVTPTSGSNNGDVSVTVSANTSAALREGSVVITGEHSGSFTIKVAQVGTNSIGFGDFGSEKIW